MDNREKWSVHSTKPVYVRGKKNPGEMEETVGPQVRFFSLLLSSIFTQAQQHFRLITGPLEFHHRLVASEVRRLDGNLLFLKISCRNLFIASVSLSKLKKTQHDAPRISLYIMTFHVSTGKSASLKLQSNFSSATGSSVGSWYGATYSCSRVCVASIRFLGSKTSIFSKRSSALASVQIYAYFNWEC